MPDARVFSQPREVERARREPDRQAARRISEPSPTLLDFASHWGPNRLLTYNIAQNPGLTIPHPGCGTTAMLACWQASLAADSDSKTSLRTRTPGAKIRSLGALVTVPSERLDQTSLLPL